MSDAPSIPQGFRMGAVKAGIKPSGGLDLAILLSDRPCTTAGTFTLNRVAAAPVQWDRRLVPSSSIRAVVINAGNANAATGAEGLANVKRTAELAASLFGCEAKDILVASTGVIGHQLPMPKLESGLHAVVPTLGSTPELLDLASRAILTTDTVPKVVSRVMELSGRTIQLLGMAKGAAMIGPRMATMLGFFITDAHVGSDDLQTLLSHAVEHSFNCISVEGHASTNDTVLLLANGAAGGDQLVGADLESFASEVKSACVELARMIPADGEGATHLITIDVEGCASRREARDLARAVADSPLVKTAIHGADPNWGRIVSAAGYAGVPFEENEVSLWLNGVALYRRGTPLAFDSARVSNSIRMNRETTINLVFERGDASIRFWTCDLTAEYIRLNADYTT